MKNKTLLFIIGLLCILLSSATNTFTSSFENTELMEGDILFQTSNSDQCKAVQLATHSPYSHCGILFKENNEYYVYEAVQPVKKTKLQTWIQHGVDGKRSIKRLKNAKAILTPTVVAKMKSIANGFIGKNYDLTFEWSDDKIYCSELVWKIYKRALNVEVGTLKALKDFDLSHPLVKAKLKERYGNNIPLNEQVISPGDIFDSNQLEEIKQLK